MDNAVGSTAPDGVHESDCVGICQLSISDFAAIGARF
jgi:hypothetical protein